MSIVEQSYSYDRASDELHRLDKTERGKWSGSALTLLNNSQDWTLDLLGNWDRVETDLNGDGTYSPTTERDSP